MDEELQLFLEDMDEQLSIMEETLLDISELSLDEIDSSMIDKLFRAMHTMKGNAGIFDFSTIVSFAHEAETLLDEIRNNKIKLNDDLIELFLKVNDHSKTLVEVYTQNKELNSEQKVLHDMLLEKLKSFLNNDPETNSQAQSENFIDNFVETSIEKDEILTSYILKVKLKKDFFKSGMDILSIIKYLDALGEVKSVKTITDDLPSFDELEVLNAYLSFEIYYETDEPKSEIVEAFEFVQEDIELSIINNEEDTTIKEKTNEQIVQSSEDTAAKETSSIKEPVKELPKQTKPSIKPQKNKKEKSLNNNFSLKVDSAKVDKLINKISEMVIANAKITRFAKTHQNSDLDEAVQTMSEMLEDVRNSVMDIRMVQVGNSFSKLRRIVNDTAKKLNKDIDFQILGGDTELDKSVIEKISDPLVHMLRNSVDHGIESIDQRIQNNKNPKGKIILKAFHDAGTIVIQIIDDGTGINKQTLLNKAIEKNLIKPDQHLNDSQIYNLIFAPGLSTTTTLSDISGRGVGMDVVKRNIQELRGSVEIESELNKGTTISIRLPLTLAIIDGFLVQSGQGKYIIPIDNIQECIELTSKRKQELEKNGYITLRSDVLPVLDINEHFNNTSSKTDLVRENIVIVRFGKSQVGLKVDELHGEYQTVIKPLGEYFQNVQGISGGTILGDGQIALIFDIQKLIEYKINHKD